ncbi:MAG: BrxA family protein [Chloroflexota bacterium]
MTNEAYTTQLQAGLGLIDETNKLLDLWAPGMSPTELKLKALDSGVFPQLTFRRMRNIVIESFKPRYLSGEGAPAARLKRLKDKLNNRGYTQLLFLYTCRANLVLADFVRSVYWTAYSTGRDTVSNDEARQFVRRANEDGKTFQPWSDGTITRVARYLTNCCSDFGLLEAGEKSVRRILPYPIDGSTTVFLAYDLHFAGRGDNSLLSHPDWGLFGLEREDVLDECKRLALQGWWIVQSAGEATRISWNYASMEAVIDALSQG